ncbi:MAG TPA: PAS domain S-box protein [Planctomycetota bacterium]|nr:PAS domain S-box protein [Planctomycetota bacterium]
MADSEPAPSLNLSEHFLEIIESAQEGVVILDSDLRYVFWNAFMEKLNRVPARDLLGKYPWEVFPFLREQGVDRMLREALQGKTINSPDICDRDPQTGIETWSSGRISPLRKRNGEIAGVLVLVRDVTQRRLAEEQLRHAEERFRNLVNYSHEVIMVIAPDGRKTYVNPAVERVLGYSVEEFLSAPLFSSVHPDDSARAREMLANILQTPNKMVTLEIRGIRKDGTVASMEAVAKNLIDVPGVNAIVVNMWDISDRKNAEAERTRLEAQIQHAQRLESLGVLAGGIAHDFNNLLVGILGNADLALNELSQHAPGRSNIEDIRTASIRASELTRQMLAYSGRGKFLVEPIDLNELIREMGHLIQVSISKKAVLKYNLDPGAPVIEGDVSQIRQVVMNLIINASEALGDETGTITLTTGNVEADERYLSEIVVNEKLAPGHYAYLEISDTGCGMDKETQARIFDPFFSTKFTGRGLGLSAVLGIVRGHKGAIKIYSEPGKGTSFKLLFPSSAQPRKPRWTPPPIGPEQWRGSGTILVIDDEELMRSVIRQSLEKFGFKVLAASDGIEGLEVFRANADSIVAVVLDMTMPRMSGEETYLELRRIRRDVRVLLTSGYNEQDATNRFAGKGPAGFIQKPFRVASLVEKIREILA